MAGLRLGIEQERRLRLWPTARIRPKSVALGVLSLLAEVDALREENTALRGAGADERAEAAIMSHAEAYRLVAEAKEMRAERDALRAALEQIRRLVHDPAVTVDADGQCVSCWTYVGDDPPEPHGPLCLLEAVRALAAARGPAGSGEREA